ncbi:MAG: hypothetical protein QOJ79_3036 [Actinomycetota bacterium]|nr:hypothetical protein [Actinomycetota bacterium]
MLSWRELVKRTSSRRLADAALVEGSWWRVLRDAYVEWCHEDTPAVRAAALRKVLPRDVALSGRAALWVLGVDVLPLSGELDVTVPRGRHLQARPRIRAHIAALPDAELCEVNGLLVVSASRAFVDVARRELLTEAVAFGDAVLRSGAATLELIDSSLARAAGLRNVRAARAVVPHLEPRSESLMESRLRMKLVLGGLARPQAQFDMYDEQGAHAGRGDLHLDGVVLEYDGREERLKKSKFNADRRRRSRISELGLEIREFTAADVYTRSDLSVCAEVRRAIVVAHGRDRSRLRAGSDTLPRPRLQPVPTRADAAQRPAA